MPSTILGANNQIILTSIFRDIDGNILQGLNPQWSTDKPSVITVSPSKDSLSATITSTNVYDTANVFANVGTFSIQQTIIVNGPISGGFIVSPPVPTGAL